jgi:hypothetical protein
MEPAILVKRKPAVRKIVSKPRAVITAAKDQKISSVARKIAAQIRIKNVGI